MTFIRAFICMYTDVDGESPCFHKPVTAYVAFISALVSISADVCSKVSPLRKVAAANMASVGLTPCGNSDMIC